MKDPSGAPPLALPRKGTRIWNPQGKYEKLLIATSGNVFTPKTNRSLIDVVKKGIERFTIIFINNKSGVGKKTN